MDVSSLSHSHVPGIVPSFLFDLNQGIMVRSDQSNVQLSSNQTTGEELVDNHMSQPSTSSAHLDSSDSDSDEAEVSYGEGMILESYTDPTQLMPESIPINPMESVQFNREFYGKSKTRIVLKKHICQICGKRMLKKSDLDRHIRVHTGERPFQCPVCGQFFSQKRSMDLHRRRKNH